MDELETELEGFCGSFGPATTGEVWSIPAERRYASQAKGKTIQYAVLAIEPCNIASLSQKSSGSSDLTAVAGIRDENLHTLLLRLILVAKESDDLSQLKAEELSTQICTHVATKYEASGDGRMSAAGPELNDSEVMQLKEFVFYNLSEPIKLADFASLFDMTIHQFLVAFKKAFFTTPAQYLISERIRRVTWLLSHSKKEITEIALSTGFTSHSHLTTAFTNRIGYPPSEFRKRYAK